jgi:hypothetical protein
MKTRKELKKRKENKMIFFENATTTETFANLNMILIEK